MSPNSDTKSYLLKGIPNEVHARAVEKCKSNNPPLTLKWVFLDLLTKWVGRAPAVRPPCEREACPESVTHVDNLGGLYCQLHAEEQRRIRPCRLLKAFELKRLQRGQLLGRY